MEIWTPKLPAALPLRRAAIEEKCGRASVIESISLYTQLSDGRRSATLLAHAHTGSANNASLKSLHLVELSARLQLLWAEAASPSIFPYTYASLLTGVDVHCSHANLPLSLAFALSISDELSETKLCDQAPALPVYIPPPIPGQRSER